MSKDTKQFLKDLSIWVWLVFGPAILTNGVVEFMWAYGVY